MALASSTAPWTEPLASFECDRPQPEAESELYAPRLNNRNMNILFYSSNNRITASLRLV